MKNPELDLIKAYKHSGGYKRNHNNVFIDKYTSRDKDPNSVIPSFMQYKGQEHTMNVLSDKMLKMNNYSTNTKFAEVDTSFNKKSASYISKQRNKRMLKNRLN